MPLRYYTKTERIWIKAAADTFDAPTWKVVEILDDMPDFAETIPADVHLSEIENQAIADAFIEHYLRHVVLDFNTEAQQIKHLQKRLPLMLNHSWSRQDTVSGER